MKKASRPAVTAEDVARRFPKVIDDLSEIIDQRVRVSGPFGTYRVVNVLHVDSLMSLAQGHGYNEITVLCQMTNGRLLRETEIPSSGRILWVDRGGVAVSALYKINAKLVRSLTTEKPLLVHVPWLVEVGATTQGVKAITNKLSACRTAGRDVPAAVSERSGCETWYDFAEFREWYVREFPKADFPDLERAHELAGENPPK